MGNTKAEIKARILAGIEDDTLNKEVGSFSNDITAAPAEEFERAYDLVDETVDQAFARTMSLENLKRRGDEYGVIYKPKFPARYDISITADSGDISFAYYDSLASDALDFKVRVPVTILDGTTGTVEVECLTAGIESNIDPVNINKIPAPISNLSVSNINTTSSVRVRKGEDDEKIELYRERILSYQAEKPGNANIAHYRFWCGNIEGVGRVRVMPAYEHGVGAHPGHVTTYVTDGDMLPAGASVVADVQTALDPNEAGDGAGFAPCNAYAHSEAAVAEDIDIEVVGPDLAVGYAWAAVKLEIETAITAYFVSIAMLKDEVNYGSVAYHILNVPGLDGYDNILINGGNASIDVSAEKVPVLDVVSQS